MDVVIAIAIFLGATLVGVAGNLLASELYDQAPSIAVWLIDRAAARMPDSERARYREEWLAHLDECPGKLGKVWHSIGCFFGVTAIIRATSTKPPSYTRDAQHQAHQEKRIQDRKSATTSGPRLGGIVVDIGAAAYTVSYRASEKAIEILSIGSEAMNRDADILDHIKDAIIAKFPPDDLGDA